MTRKSEAPKKRGRRRKDHLWQQKPRNGVDLTLGGANAFADKVFDQLPSNSWATYHYWCDRYDEVATNKIRFISVSGEIRATPRTERAAKGYANEKTSKHFRCSIKTVCNRIKALWAASENVSAWQHENVFPRMRQYNEDVQRLTRAMTLLHHPTYADLERPPGVRAGGNSCRFLLTDTIYKDLEPTLLDPQCLAQFQSPDGAKRNSSQRLASVLAAAFVRAHAAKVAAEQRAEKAEKELGQLKTRTAARAVAPAYTQGRK